MSTTVTYKGNALTTVDNQTRTLLTSGKYMEDDLTLVDVSGGGGGARLPSGYTEVDFISATGSQYIELDYVPVQNDHVSTKFIKFSGDIALFSAGTGTYQWLFYANYYRYFSSGSAPQFSPSISTNKLYELEAGATTTAKAPGATTSTVTSSYGGAIDGSNNKLNIGRRANNTSFFNGYIYEFIVTNNDTVKLDLIPCIQESTQKAGMYDLVSDTFYASAGSSDFYAGPESLTDAQALSALLGG